MRHRLFRESRRRPTTLRAWRQTPAFVGDLVGHVDDPEHIMFVTGVLPRGRLEVVTIDRLREALLDGTELEAINQALADRRLFPRSVPRWKVSPLTRGMVDELLADEQADTDADTQEVTA